MEQLTQKKDERPLLFRVLWFEYQGHSYVEAKDYDEAVKKAHAGQDFAFQEQDDYESHPEVNREDVTDHFDPEEIEDMKKEAGG